MRAFLSIYIVKYDTTFFFYRKWSYIIPINFLCMSIKYKSYTNYYERDSHFSVSDFQLLTNLFETFIVGD